MGHLELPNGATYDGQFMKGLPNGVGVMRFTDSSRYEGKLLLFFARATSKTSRPYFTESSYGQNCKTLFMYFIK